MTHRDTDRQPLPSVEAADDVEILEVVGLNDAAVVEADAGPRVEINPDEIEIIFDDGEDTEQARETAKPGGAAFADEHLRDRLLRLQADFENFKKRIERERADHFRYATFGLVSRILPVLDNLERALAASRPDVQSDPLVEGVLLIHRQLVSELEAEGLRAMPGVGETFDPAHHDVVATDTASPAPPHTVTQVLQKGYFLHERVLRPAMVRVRVDPSEGASGADERKES